MNIQVICHSSVLITTANTSILCDPWYFGEVFNHGWQLYPAPEYPPLSDAVAASVTHLFISHEHPDHLHFPTLDQFDDSFKRRVIVIFQKNNSDKVFSQLAKIGFQNLVALPHMQEYSPEPQVSLYIYQHRQIDSALIVNDNKHVVVNLNDAEIDCGRVLQVEGDIPEY